MRLIGVKEELMVPRLATKRYVNFVASERQDMYIFIWVVYNGQAKDTQEEVTYCKCKAKVKDRQTDVITGSSLVERERKWRTTDCSRRTVVVAAYRAQEKS